MYWRYTLDINKEIADIKKLLNILIEMQKEKNKEVHNHYHYHNDNTFHPVPQVPYIPWQPVWTVASNKVVGPDGC